MGAISGWGGRLSISQQEDAFGINVFPGTILPVTTWSIENMVDPLDVSTMSGQRGYADYIHGVTEYVINFDCIYDTTLNPFLFADPNLNPGESGRIPSTKTQYYTLVCGFDTSGVKGSDGRWYSFRRVMLTSVHLVDECRGVLKYAVQAKSTRGASYAAGSDVTRTDPPLKPYAQPG